MSVSSQTFTFVSELVRRRSAIQLGPGKEYLVESRLLPLARAKGINGPDAVDQYVSAVHNDQEALSAVVEALTTNETSWLRDVSPFQILREHVYPDRREKNRGDLRIWSAACSTGQEPYSIAMTLLDLPDNRFSITATDLSRQVLEKAIRGEYSQFEMNRGLPASMLVRYFRRAGTGWVIDSRVREKVTFRQHNLLGPVPCCGPFDVVFLRNVLIYFDQTTKAAILTRVSHVIAPGGYLFLGAAETPYDGNSNGWQRIDVVKGSVYRWQGA